MEISPFPLFVLRPPLSMSLLMAYPLIGAFSLQDGNFFLCIKFLWPLIKAVLFNESLIAWRLKDQKSGVPIALKTFLKE